MSTWGSAWPRVSEAERWARIGLTQSRELRFAGCVTGAPDLAKLTVAEKDRLILSLLPVAWQLERALARIAELEARNAELLARLAQLERIPPAWAAYLFRSI